MRSILSALLFSLASGLLLAGQPEPTPQAPSPPPNYDGLSKLLHRLAVKRLPKEIEDASHWGMTIPLPEKRLPLPRLRTYLKEGEQTVLPHGAWRKFKGKIDEPQKDLKIVVRDFQPADDGKNYRLTFDADAWLHGAGQWQQWQKGLLLVEADGEAQANIVAHVVCDVAVTIDVTKFPPKVDLEPKVIDLKLDLQALRFPNPPDPTDGPRLEDRLRGPLAELLHAAEPTLKDEVNRSLADSFRDPRNALPVAELMKVLPPMPKR